MKERFRYNNNSLLFLIKTGGINEGKYSGISHLLEHLLFSGTKNIPSSSLLNKTLEKYGTKINGYTTHQLTAYHMTFPPSKLTNIFKIFSEIIKESILDCYKIEEEKRVVLNEKFYRKDLIQNEFYKVSMKYLFKNTIFEEFVIGDENSLNLIKKHHLHAYLVSQYLLKNSVLVLSGKFKLKTKQIEKMILGEFGIDSLTKSYEMDTLHHNYKNYKKELDYFKRINKNVDIKNIKLNFKNKYFKTNSHQIYVYIYFKIKTSLNKKNEKDEKDNKIQNFIDSYLTTGMSSLLSDKLREKEHLTYKIKTTNIELSEFTLYNIHYNTLSNNIYLEKTLHYIFEILDKLKNELLTPEIIKFTNNKIVYRKLINNLSNIRYNQIVGEELLFTDINSKHYKKTENKKIDIDKIKPIEIKNYCNKIFDKKNRCILLFSPIKPNLTIEKLLKSE